LEFIVDETTIKVGMQHIWLWAPIEPKNKMILGLNISKERNRFVAERFIAELIKINYKHPVYTDGGTWYPPACNIL